jgi:murein DD-endopeptidase MepM/ murein hydrolase activator NlpD
VVLIAERNEIAGGAAGRYVKLEHAGGEARSWYIHLDAVSVSKGQQVYAGQQVGTVGLTGVKNSPSHLHFAVAVPGSGGYVYIDPAPLAASWNGGGGSGSGLLGLAAVVGLALLLWRSLR